MDQQLRDAYLLLLQHHLLNQQLKLKESGGGERDQGKLQLIGFYIVTFSRFCYMRDVF